MIKPIKAVINYPLSLETDNVYVKNHLQFDTTDTTQDEYLSNLLKASTEQAEDYCNTDFSSKQNTLTLKNFYGNSYRLEESTFASMDSIVNKDTSTLLTYELYTEHLSTTIVLDESLSDATIEVKYKTGFEPENVPIQVKQAILIYTGKLYRNRDDSEFSSIKYTDCFERLLSKYKIY